MHARMTSVHLVEQQVFVLQIGGDRVRRPWQGLVEGFALEEVILATDAITTRLRHRLVAGELLVGEQTGCSGHMITLRKHHISVLNDRTSILVQYVLLTKLAKVAPCKHVGRSLVKWALLHELL